MSTIRFTLPPRDMISPNNEKDPLPFYYKLSTRWIYRHRLQMGLNLLPANGKRLLEVGVGSGILIPTLTAHYQSYLGTDLVLAKGLQRLVAPGCSANFATADLLDATTLPANSFDAIVCFSVLEHIRDSDGAARSLAHALASGGTLITGYPMVNDLMTKAFDVIGYKGIDEDHVAPPSQISAALARVLTPVARVAFPPLATVTTALYQCTAWRKA